MRHKFLSKRGFIIAVASLAAACTSAPLAEKASQKSATTIVMTTDYGPIEIALDMENAPVTAANFLAYVDAGAFDGAYFYRTVRDNNDNNPSKIDVIQGGINGDFAETYASLFPAIPIEPTDVTGLSHIDGAVSMARFTPDSATSEFFVSIGENLNLDQGGARNPDGLGFAVFGRVTEGMTIVRKIHAAEADAPPPDPYITGQVLSEPVIIQTARRAE